MLLFNAHPYSPLTGSPISTPSHSPLPRTPATSTPVHSKQSSSSVLNNPYIIVDKPGGMASSSAASAGTPPLPAARTLLDTGSGPGVPEAPTQSLKTAARLFHPRARRFPAFKSDMS